LLAAPKAAPAGAAASGFLFNERIAGMATDVQVLQTLELFRELSGDELETIAELATPFRVREGEVLTRRNDPANTFYLVLSGNFMIYFRGGQAFTVHDAGEAIGMATLMAPHYYRGTTVALTDGEVLSIPGGKFQELVQGHSGLAEKLMRKLSGFISHRTPFFEAAAKAEKTSGNG
jgi:CRP-like cAMP-binding protein